MDEYQSLSHSKWECKYHVVFGQVLGPEMRVALQHGQGVVAGDPATSMRLKPCSKKRLVASWYRS